MAAAMQRNVPMLRDEFLSVVQANDRDQLLKTAAEQAAMWRDVDAGLYVMKLAEAEALGRVLRVILPDEELRALRLVKEEE